MSCPFAPENAADAGSASNATDATITMSATASEPFNPSLHSDWQDPNVRRFGVHGRPPEGADATTPPKVAPPRRRCHPVVVRERLRVFLTVFQDPNLRRIEVAFTGFSTAEFATWIAILVFAYSRG